jgi:hypothetical protein
MYGGAARGGRARAYYTALLFVSGIMSVRGGDIYLLYRRRRRRIKMCGNRLGGGTIRRRDVASVRAIPRVRVTARMDHTRRSPGTTQHTV